MKIKVTLEVKRRRGRRRKLLFDDFKEKRGYWKLKEEALNRILWMAIDLGAMDLLYDRLRNVQQLHL
jgi:hypothetical protein